MMVRRTPLMLILVLAAASGCATQGEKMIASYSDTRSTLSNAHAQVDKTLGALAGLRQSPAATIQKAFTEYKSQVKKLELEGDDARTRAGAMKADADAHIRKWEKEQAEVSDPQIKATLESRQQAVRSNFALLMAYAEDVAKRYKPFLKRNQDLVQALSIDLTPEAVASLSPSIDQVFSEGLALKERMTAMEQGLANITDGRSPIEQ